MGREAFRALMHDLGAVVAGRALAPELGEALDRELPPQGETFRTIEAACHAAIAAGWMCTQGGASGASSNRGPTPPASASMSSISPTSSARTIAIRTGRSAW